MLSKHEEQVLWRAARAQRAYWDLVKRFSDDARRRLALHDRYIEIQSELRGDRKRDTDHATPVDCWIPLEQAVRLEVIRRTPQIRVEVAAQRERRRLAVDCGYVPLKLSTVARVRRKLRAVIWRSGLSIREVADALGVVTSTLDRHLGGTRPSAQRAAYYQRLEAIDVDGEHIIIQLRRGVPTRKKFGWRAPLEDDDAADD